jgi:hypothetical protein
MGASTSLRAALKKRFIPYAEQRGFSVDQSHQPISTTFRRRRGDIVHAFDIQWDKGGRPRFVVNCGMSSLREIPEEQKESALQEVWPFAADKSGRLFRRRGLLLGSWFRLDVPLHKRVFLFRSSYDPDAVVDELLELFPELETWWDSGTVGPHMRIDSPTKKEANQPSEPMAGLAPGHGSP